MLQHRTFGNGVSRHVLVIPCPKYSLWKSECRCNEKNYEEENNVLFVHFNPIKENEKQNCMLDIEKPSWIDVCSLVYSFIRSLVVQFFNSFVCSLARSFGARLLVRSFLPSLAPSLVRLIA